HTTPFRSRHVVAVAVVVVAGDVAGAAVHHVAGGVGEGVPDRLAPPVLLDRPLDLVGSRCGTPDEVLREDHPLTAPCMIPPMICLPNRAKTMTSGRVPTAVPARPST